jgi:histidyl-tRNA synthetase
MVEAPKGTRDFPPGRMEIKQKLIDKIKFIYQKYGYQMWEGPAFEYLKTLTLKSGPEVEKEIYSFADKGGRELGLRFELTSSLARIVSSYKDLKKPIKAFSIGKVWRYERPQQGRYREFYQADADLFGVSDMLGETELFSMVAEVLEEVGFEDWKIYLNNRKILNGIALSLGIEDAAVRAQLFRSLDKLAK